MSLWKPTVSATGVIDDFEDNDLSEYELDTGSYQTQSSTVFEGTYALEAQIPSSGTYVNLGSTSGLDNYPQSGDKFSYRVRFADSSNHHLFYFATQSGGTSDPDAYYLNVSPKNTHLSLRRRTNSSDTHLATDDTVFYSVDEWFELIVDWGAGGSFTVTLNKQDGTQITQISGSDSTYSSGGIIWRSYNYDNAENIYYDIAKVL